MKPDYLELEEKCTELEATNKILRIGLSAVVTLCDSQAQLATIAAICRDVIARAATKIDE